MSATIEGHAAISELLAGRAGGDPGLVIPPPCFIEMSGEFVTYEGGVMLETRFPVERRYAQLQGLMQGGFVAAAVDNTLGPLSYLVAPPSVTLQLAMTYLRPVTPDTPTLRILGRLSQRTKRYLYLVAEVFDDAERVLATAQAQAAILDQRGG